jgi:hypothetical protein
MPERLRVVVLGMMGRCPYGGQTWGYLNWMLGLHKLGHEVWYIEDDSVWPYDPVKNSLTSDGRYAATHIQHSMEQIGLGDRWAYRLHGEAGSWGLDEARTVELYASCDLLLNIAGAVALRDEHLAARMRVLVQTDPVTMELRLAMGDDSTRLAFANHHVVATYGENYGAPDCGVPLNGIRYVKTRQATDGEWWNVVYDPAATAFTTIGNYRQSGSDVWFNGEWYRWSKHYEWEKFLTLAERTSQPFEIATTHDDAIDRARLESHGWRLKAAHPFTLDVFGAYRDYFRESRGAFTVAKDQNVRLRSGWFSDREACYLASGKPVITQDTGFGAVLPTGEGLFAVNTVDDAHTAIDAINGDYARHCAAARAIAEEFFDATKVAKRLLDEVDRAEPHRPCAAVPAAVD